MLLEFPFLSMLSQLFQVHLHSHLPLAHLTKSLLLSQSLAVNKVMLFTMSVDTFLTIRQHALWKLMQLEDGLWNLQSMVSEFHKLIMTVKIK